MFSCLVVPAASQNDELLRLYEFGLIMSALKVSENACMAGKNGKIYNMELAARALTP